MTRVNLLLQACWTLRRVTLRILMWGVVGVPLGMALGLVAGAMMDRAPVLISDLHEDDGVAVQGGFISLMATVERSRICPSVTQRYIWRWADLAHSRQHVIPIEGTALPFLGGSERIMLSLPLPAGTPEGRWFYTAITADNCSWLPRMLQGRISRTADVPITVERQ